MATQLFFVRGEIPPNVLAARIPCLRESLGRSDGFLFPEKYREKTLVALGWDQDAAVELITSEWGVRELTTTPFHAFSVDIACTEPLSTAWWEYLHIVKRWCEEHPQPYPVTIHYSSERHRAYGNGTLHLCFGGQAVFPVKVQVHDRDVFYQSAHCWIGELGPEHDHCRALIPTLLSEFLSRIVGKTPTHCEGEFIAALVERTDADQKTLTTQIDKQRKTVEKLQQQLVDALRTLGDLERRLGTMVTTFDHRQKHFQQQFVSLARRDYVQSLHVTKESISVITDRILIELHGMTRQEPQLFDIGAFQLDLFPSGGSGCVKITNLTRRGPSPRPEGRSGFHHPHVSYDGTPCLGTIGSSLPRLIARDEYAAAFDLLVNFLRTVSVQDTYGRMIDKWPQFTFPVTGGSS